MIRVATTGVFEFVCPRGTYELGDRMGVEPMVTSHAGGQPAASILMNQRVVKAVDPKVAIARVAKRVPIADNSVLVDIRSTVMTGGIAGTTPHD